MAVERIGEANNACGRANGHGMSDAHYTLCVIMYILERIECWREKQSKRKRGGRGGRQFPLGENSNDVIAGGLPLLFLFSSSLLTTHHSPLTTHYILLSSYPLLAPIMLLSRRTQVLDPGLLRRLFLCPPRLTTSKTPRQHSP